MRVKLQPASSSKLPAFSPLTPPAVISQLLLLDNPLKVRSGVWGCGGDRREAPGWAGSWVGLLLPSPVCPELGAAERGGCRPACSPWPATQLLPSTSGSGLGASRAFVTHGVRASVVSGILREVGAGAGGRDACAQVAGALLTRVPVRVLAQEPIRLRYKLTFNQGGQPFSEVGEVKDVPDPAVPGAA